MTSRPQLLGSVEPEKVMAQSTAPALEHHFTPKQLGRLWGLDESTIRRLFEDTPGVLRIGKSGRRDGRRDYISLRIPASVAARVHAERSKV